MKKVTFIILAVIMLLTAASIGMTSSAKGETKYKVGDHIQFGSYPQSEVKDKSTIKKLNALKLSWKSFGYYGGSGDSRDGKMKPTDYMKYADITLGGSKYRAVKFSKYRPFETGLFWFDSYPSPLEQDYQYQYTNGYYVNSIYWFKYEPIVWRVLDPEKGLVMSESILDSQPFHNYCLEVEYWKDNGEYDGLDCFGDSKKTFYIGDYYKSSIRSWLNKDFYNMAFDNEQRENIKETYIENNFYNSDEGDGIKDKVRRKEKQDSKDNVFLLSEGNLINSDYGFASDHQAGTANRKAWGTDYAKAQGLGERDSEGSEWWLRTPSGPNPVNVLIVFDGISGYSTAAYDTSIGVRPACELISLNKVICAHKYDDGKVTKAATYTATGVKTYTCTVCKATKTETIAKLKAPTVAKVSGLKASKVKANAIKLAWNKAANADKYEVYRSTDGKKWTKLTTTTKLAYTDKAVKAGTKYQYKVRGIHSESKATGAYSAVLKTQTLTAAPKISSLKSTKAKTATVKWSKITGAKSYIVYISKDGKKFTKAATTTKTTVTLSKLTAGKKVYVKVKAVNAYGKNSAYSAVKSVKVKK